MEMKKREGGGENDQKLEELMFMHQVGECEVLFLHPEGGLIVVEEKAVCSPTRQNRNGDRN